MVAEIKRMIEQYEYEKENILGSLAEDKVKYTLYKFFPDNYSGQKVHQNIVKVLESEINYRKQLPIDLRYTVKLDFRWVNIEQEDIGHRVWVKINKKVQYCGIKEESEYRDIKKQYKIVRSNGYLKIEEENIRNEVIIEDETVQKQQRIYNKYRHKVRKEVKKEIIEVIKKEEQLMIPRGVYRRDKSIAYAKKYALTPNTKEWKNYERYGGDCTNFVSQCLYAGEIPFDHEGKHITDKWYWYSDTYRTPSFTGAESLRIYMVTNKGFGLVAKQVESKESLEIGDIVQLQKEGKSTHTMLVVGIVYNPNDESEILDLLIAQHSTDEEGRGYNIPLSTKKDLKLYFKILGYNK